jgi:ABC-type phosphate transport system substrate-binding protein
MKKIIKQISAAILFTLAAVSSSTAGVVIVVSVDSSVSSVSEDDVIKLFLGKKKELDGVKLVPTDQDVDSATRVEFYEKIVQKSETQLRSYWSRLIFTGKGQAPQVIGSDSDVKGMISSNPNMIGYIDESFVDSSIKVVYRK